MATAKKTEASKEPSSWDKAMEFVLDHEGRITEDVPGDPGGPTKWGITQADYNRYRKGKQEMGTKHVFHASKAEIYDIYAKHYWRPYGGDSLSYPLALTLFDSSVNVGNSRVNRWVQEIVGADVDGVFGPKTAKAMANFVKEHGEDTLISGILSRRQAHYERLAENRPSMKKFLKGWMNRLDDLEGEVL